MFRWIIVSGATISLLLTALLFLFSSEEVREVVAECRSDDKGCTLISDGVVLGRFDFDLERNAVVQPFRAMLSSQLADSASIEITGINYYMGYNHYPLKKQAGRFYRVGVMPGCIYRTMHWRVRILFTSGSIGYKADYSFFVRRDLDGLE